MLGWFNHEILAVKLPADVSGPPIVAADANHPILGRLLIFDPTDEYTQFGKIRGALQDNYGLLLSGDGGVAAATADADDNRQRNSTNSETSHFREGTLSGEFHEVQMGDPATEEQRLRAAFGNQFQPTRKPIEFGAHSLPTFQLTKLKW